jgi:hypothetical protein
MSLKTFKCRQEGDRVIVEIDGRGYTIPWKHALDISRGLYRVSKQAEEFASANRIIADHALLTRAGFPVGLSNNPKIKDEVRKESAWNGFLRKHFPGGVKSREVFGTPSIKRGTP